MSFLDKMLNPEINKTAMEAVGTDANDTFERKVVAHPWVNELLELDADLIDKEYQANLAAEAKLLGKTAAYEQGETVKETIEKDFKRDVSILSDYVLAELLAEAKAHKDNITQEKYGEYKEDAKKQVASSREKAEKALLELTADHTVLDWRKSFERFEKESKVEQPAEKKLYTPEVPEKEADFSKPSEDKFKLPTKEEMIPAGNGREVDERKEVTKEASLEKKAEIFRQNVPTKGGNTLSFFYNPENNLLVVDLIAANEEGGNELVRQTIDESSMLEHTASKKVADKVKDNPADDKGNLAMPEGKKSAGDKPVESVEESTLLSSPKEIGDKSDQAAEESSPEKGDKAKDIESVNKEAKSSHTTECNDANDKSSREICICKEKKEAHCGSCPGDPGVKTVEPVSPLKREELPVEVKAEGEVCPVCSGPGRDLGNLGSRDHFKCEGCGITFSHEKEASCEACASLHEIKSQVSKADVIKKIAEISSPWSVEKLADGTEAIVRREIVSTEEKDLTKESEEKKEEEIQK